MKERVSAKVMTALLSGILLAGMGGCYREVINAKGIGADARYPRRARSSEPKLDRAIDDVIREIEE